MLKDFFRSLGAKASGVAPRPARLADLERAYHDARENGEPAALERACRALLELRPAHVDALTTFGELLVRRDEMDEAAELFSAAERSAAAQPRVTRVYRHERLDIAQVVRSTPYCREFADVLVDTAYWSLMQGDAVFSHDTHGKDLATSPFVSGRVSRDGSRVIATYAPPCNTIDEPCLLVGGDHNYSHWLFRNVLKLAAAERAGRLFERPWLLNRDLTPHQEGYLHLLGLPDSKRILVERGEVIACTNVLVPGLLISKKMIGYGIEWLHRRLAAAMTPRAEAGGRIFVSRRGAPHRRLTNEDALFARLEALGFSHVVAGQLTVEAQIREFSSARVIVGVHGASMTNILFAPPGTAIVEINSVAKSHMEDFRRIAGAAGHRYARVLSDGYSPRDRPVHENSDYGVDVGRVLEVLGSLTGGEIRSKG